jgi:hypothetical protein
MLILLHWLKTCVNAKSLAHDLRYDSLFNAKPGTPYDPTGTGAVVGVGDVEISVGGGDPFAAAVANLEVQTASLNAGTAQLQQQKMMAQMMTNPAMMQQMQQMMQQQMTPQAQAQMMQSTDPALYGQMMQQGVPPTAAFGQPAPPPVFAQPVAAPPFNAGVAASAKPMGADFFTPKSNY